MSFYRQDEELDRRVNPSMDPPLLGRLRSRDPSSRRFASLPSGDRALAMHAETVGALQSIANQVNDLSTAIVRREQNELPFRIEEHGLVGLDTGEMDIQPQTSGLEEIRTILVTCQYGIPANLTLLLDASHTLYLTGSNALATQVFTLTQQELLVHSATRVFTWTAGPAGNKLNARITGKAIPQLKGRAVQ